MLSYMVIMQTFRSYIEEQASTALVSFGIGFSQSGSRCDWSPTMLVGIKVVGMARVHFVTHRDAINSCGMDAARSFTILPELSYSKVPFSRCC